MSHPLVIVSRMKLTKENSKKQNTLFSRWREVGGYFNFLFRMSSDGHIELKGKFIRPEEIPLLCSQLSRRLSQEFEVQKRQVSLIENQKSINQERERMNKKALLSQQCSLQLSPQRQERLKSSKKKSVA